jgi:glycerophosphoryl diester phosphodiesterase
MYKRLAIAVVATATMLTIPSGAANAEDEQGEQPTLVGRALLPAEALAPGPPSGAAVPPPGESEINGIVFPRPQQPVAGFSAVVAGRERGEYLAMPDNGFGAKANSRDFLIRAYFVRPNFKTARGGSGAIAVDTRPGKFIEFRDPDRLIGFPIVNDGTSERLLTGGDIDPESLQQGADGDLWVGDEFGPWILHFDATGRLLDPPFATPGLISPNNPFLGGGTATQPNSRGYEAMAISPDGERLYAALEGATVAEAGSTGRHVFEFSVRDKAFTGRSWTYRTELPAYMVADMWALDAHRLVVIERDAGRGLDAVFRKVYLVGLRTTDATGSLVKSAVVDLAAVPDPDLISLPATHEGDVGLGNPFRVTCESVEAIHPIAGNKLLIGCDNNLPNTGRNPGIADDTELIVVKVPDALEQE